MLSPPDFSLEALCHTPEVVPIQAATPGTHTGGYAWYPYGRLCLVPIRAAMPGTHTGDHAWYTLARSMTILEGIEVPESRLLLGCSVFGSDGEWAILDARSLVVVSNPLQRPSFIHQVRWIGSHLMCV